MSMQIEGLNGEQRYLSDIHDKVFTNNWDKYLTTPDEYEKLIVNHFNQEQELQKSYEGRELYELIQNVEDAGSSELWVKLKGSTLTIANNGDNPFSVEGYSSIMIPYNSPKSKKRYIGNKGLGFRSVLNWTSSLTICSLLSPGSKEGVKSRFSEEIAYKKYEALREVWRQNGLTAKWERNLDEYAQDHGKKYPIALLSVTEVEAWNPDPGVTTKIEMELQEGVIEDVKKKIDALKNSQFLLFLKNLNKLHIDVDGLSSEILCERRDNGRFIDIKIIEGGELKETQSWIAEHIEEGNIYAAAARRIDRNAKTLNQHDYYFHSFFPTLIKLGFGCVLHATVELDSSRNLVRDSSEKPFELLAAAAEKLADSLKTYFNENITWDAYDVFVEKDKGWSNDPHFSDFIERMAEIRETTPLAPTVGGLYHLLDDTFRITEEFSEFATSLGGGIPAFENLLLTGFTSEGIFNDLEFEERVPVFQSFANDTSMPIETRAKFIAVLKRIHWPSQSLPKEGPLHLFTNRDSKVIRDKAYLFTGEQREVPSIVEVNLIDDALAEALKKEMEGEISELKREIENEGRKRNDDRLLYDLLHQIADIGYTDFSFIKTKLFQTSKIPHTMAQDAEMVKYLFTYFEDHKGRKKDDDDSKMPEGLSLHILDREGNPRPICELLYGQTEGGRAPMINDWAKALGLPEEREPEIKEFLVDELHMAVKTPMKLQDWTKYIPFLTSHGLVRTKCDREDVKNELKKQDLSQYAYIFDPIYVKNNNPATILRDILSDPNAIKALLNGNEGNFYIYYVPQSVVRPWKTVTPAKFSLGDKLKGLEKYILSNNSWVGTQLIDVKSLSLSQRKNFEVIAKIFGAKEDESDYSLSEIFEAINDTDEKNHRVVYQQMKRLLKKKDDRGEFKSPEVEFKLWATKAGTLLSEKIEASKCYYADNTPPKAILDRFPILDIGKREGVDQVTKYFGVNPVADIVTAPVVDHAIRLQRLESEFKDLLNSRLLYILAARCEAIRDGGLIETAQTFCNQLKKLKFSMWSGLLFSIEIDGQAEKEAFSLEKGRFLKYFNIKDKDKDKEVDLEDEDGATGWEYLIEADDWNIAANRAAVSALASVLCSLFRLQETNWGERFYNILRLPLSDLDYKLNSDYPEEFIAVLKDVAEGKKLEIKPRLHLNADDFPALMKIISDKKKNEIYEECLEKGPEMQKTFLQKLDDIEDRARKDIEDVLDSMEEINSKAEAREKIVRTLNIDLDSPVSLKEFKIQEEYDDWLKENNLNSNFSLQAYPDIYPLLFFKGNIEVVKKLWAECEKAKEEELQRLDQLKKNYQPSRLEECEDTDFSIERPEPKVSGNGGGDRRGKRGPASSEAKNVYGGKAELDVKAFLEERGWEVHERSSNSDPTKTDNYNYDLLAIDPDDIKHYIDVKYTGDGIVHISEGQYNKAEKMSKEGVHYDLYVVYEGKVHPITDAYKKLEGSTTPDSYRFKISH